MAPRTPGSRIALLVLAGVLLAPWPNARACILCSSIDKTYSSLFESTDVVVIATLAKGPELKLDLAPGQTVDRRKLYDPKARSTFQVAEVLKGPQHVKVGQQVAVLHLGKEPTGTRFFIAGADTRELEWTKPVPLTERSLAYFKALPGLPAEGVKRLRFFLPHLEDQEEVLARDAYDEFAKTPYDVNRQLRDEYDRATLWKWIRDPKIPAVRRRLYLMLLSTCGTAEDIAPLEQMISGGDEVTAGVLDPLVACYLTLRGPEGMELIDRQFLANPEAKFKHIYSVVQALRVLGQVTDRVPRERLIAGFRSMLDRPQLADLVIPDLARWEDWDSMDRLVQLFKDSNQQSNRFVRVPVLRYLMVCPLPAAKQHLEELGKLDSQALRQARLFLPGSGLSRPQNQK